MSYWGELYLEKIKMPSARMSYFEELDKKSSENKKDENRKD